MGRVNRAGHRSGALKKNQPVRVCFLDHTMEMFKKDKLSVDARLALK